MSHKIKILYYALWILHPVLEAGIATFMLCRGLIRQFKFFFGYIVAQLLAFAVVFPAYCWRSYFLCFYLYWGFTAISVAFGFLVIHEVFVDVFRSFHTLRDLGTRAVQMGGPGDVAGGGRGLGVEHFQRSAPLMQAIITAQRCVRIIQVGMVLFLLFFAHYVGVSRKQLSFGIALGFGAFAMYRADPDLLLGRPAPYRSLDERGQHDRIQQQPCVMAGLRVGEASGSRCVALAAAAAALGAEPFRHSSSGPGRFAHSNV